MGSRPTRYPSSRIRPGERDGNFSIYYHEANGLASFTVSPRCVDGPTDAILKVQGVLISMCPGGEIGRRKGLKILFRASGVWVQVPPRAPEFSQFDSCQGCRTQTFTNADSRLPVPYAPCLAANWRSPGASHFQLAYSNFRPTGSNRSGIGAAFGKRLTNRIRKPCCLGGPIPQASGSTRRSSPGCLRNHK